MSGGFMMLARSLATAALVVLAIPPAIAEEEKPVWFWMEDCGGPHIRLEIEFDGTVVQDATFPICRRLRSARPDNQAKTLLVRLAPPRPVLWSGYKDETVTSPAYQDLEFQVWESGADPKHMILGVTVMTKDTIYMNTLTLVFPDKSFESQLAEGVLIRSVPLAAIGG